MKKIKKIISIILILILTIIPFLPTLNVKAEDTEFILSDTITKETDTNSKLITNDDITITVTNFENISTAKIFGYKIIDVFYNEATNEVSYEFTDDFQTFIDSNENYKELTIEKYFGLTSDNLDGTASQSVITTSTLNILLSDYLISGGGNSNSFIVSGDDANGYVATATVETGVYVLGTSGTRDIYGVMVANAVPIVNENGEWSITSPTIVAKKSAVSNELLTVTKQIMNMEQMTMTVELEYKVTIPELPTNAIELENKKQFAFGVLTTDFENVSSILTLKNGENTLTINEDGKVYNGEELIENIIVSDGLVQILDITKLSNKNFVATYTKDIPSENIVFGEAGNNFIGMTAYDSKQYEQNGYSAYTVVNATAYAYAIGIQNLEKDTDDVYLNGANYEMYRSYDAETNTLSDKVDIGFATVEGGAMTAVSETGKYYLKQVKAPSGYTLSKDIIEIDVNPGSANESEDGMYFAVAYNQKMWFLPSTGGAGTIIYTIIGLGIIIASSIGIIYYRKKKQNNTKNK